MNHAFCAAATSRGRSDRPGTLYLARRDQAQPFAWLTAIAYNSSFLRPIPGVRVNRAFALGKARGPAAGLELLTRADIDAAAYPYVHLVRGALLADAGDGEAAALSLREAARCARNEHERAQIEKRISELPAPWGGR